MIVGRVNAQLEPTIPIDVISVIGTKQTLTAVVDTGFDGELLLPRSLLESIGWPYRGRRTAQLGDGTRTTFDVYRGTVHWETSARSVQVLESAGDVIVGMRLLTGVRITIDAVVDGPVTVSALHEK
jgi:clan AA aspartic protease